MIYYVSLNGNDLNDGTSISTAKRTIHAAIQLCIDGDVIFIGSGIYVENITIRKNIFLKGNSIDTTVIKSTGTGTPTISITDGSSGSTISCMTIEGAYTTRTTTGSGNADNGNSCIYIYNTDTVNKPSIINLTFDTIRCKHGSNGIVWNNFSSESNYLRNCIFEENEGNGLKIASYLEYMNGFILDGCTIRNNNHSAITFNPSGNYRPNCTNFVVCNSTIENNSRLTLNNIHDVSFFGFNGNLRIENTTIVSNHSASKQINGSSPTTGGWGMIVYGRRNSDGTLYNSANISLSNVIFSGDVIKSGIGIERYNSLGTITMNNVDMKNYIPNKANLTWRLFIIGHNDTTKSFSIGNTKLTTIALSQSGNVDATNASFYHQETKQLLSKTNPLISSQIYYLVSPSGKVFFTPSNILFPNGLNTLSNAINTTTKKTLYLNHGIYQVKNLVSNTKRVLIVSIGGISRFQHSM
jgi:hypothetical protein